MFNPMSSGVIFSMICALSRGPQSTTCTPGIFSINLATVILDSWLSPDIKQSQSMGPLKFIRAPLLMLLNAQMTLVSGKIFCALSEAAPSDRYKHRVGDPPIAVSKGPVASINIFPAAPSLIDRRVAL
ncbi:MAG: hypothetical protein A4E26_01639 [Methanobacterium sp. PtaU1.Bin097]|nr:MAG: hypothetical protein A4E26_01639 [Methanobacterium sp. PtaU1.Bin097]